MTGPRVGQALVVELVVDQERGEEERPQQHLDRLGVGPVEGVGAARQVAVVGGGQRRFVRRGVDEPGAVGVGRGDDADARTTADTRRGGCPASTPSASLLSTSAKPHVGTRPQPSSAREEVPVGHRLAEDRVGDVVRGHPEGVDPQQRLARLELGGLGLGDPALAEIVLFH